VVAMKKADAQDQISRMLPAIKRSAATTYILDSRCRFIYCNPAWNRFAISNGAPELTCEAVLGSDLFDVIPEVLSAVYSAAFQKVLREGVCWEKSYQCSSPRAFRMFRMRIHLLKPQSWFLVTNSLIRTRSHAKVAAPDPNTYVDSDGLITMCAHCRCSRRVDKPAQWDFVPKYLRLRGKASLHVSHGFCPLCCAYFYPLATASAR